MSNTGYDHNFNIGDAVLARVGGIPIPGVIEARQEDKFLVRLSGPWTDETGKSSDEAWLTSDQLDPSIDEETGGTEALPG